jgi:hypothetical protein
MERDQSFWITSSEHQGTMPKGILDMKIICQSLKILSREEGCPN